MPTDYKKLLEACSLSAVADRDFRKALALNRFLSANAFRSTLRALVSGDMARARLEAHDFFSMDALRSKLKGSLEADRTLASEKAGQTWDEMESAASKAQPDLVKKAGELQAEGDKLRREAREIEWQGASREARKLMEAAGTQVWNAGQTVKDDIVGNLKAFCKTNTPKLRP